MGAKEASVVGGAFVEGSPTRGRALAAPSMPWIAVVLNLDITNSICLVLVGTRVPGCFPPGLVWANTMAWVCC